jgi:hypothetical protein
MQLLPIVWALAAEIGTIVAQNSAAAAVPSMTRLPRATLKWGIRIIHPPVGTAELFRRS